MRLERRHGCRGPDTRGNALAALCAGQVKAIYEPSRDVAKTPTATVLSMERRKAVVEISAQMVAMIEDDVWIHVDEAPPQRISPRALLPETQLYITRRREHGPEVFARLCHSARQSWTGRGALRATVTWHADCARSGYGSRMDTAERLVAAKASRSQSGSRLVGRLSARGAGMTVIRRAPSAALDA